MRYPELTDDQRRLLFDIVGVSQEAGHGYYSLWVDFFRAPQIVISVESTRERAAISRESRGNYVTVKVLEDRGYLRVDPRHEEKTIRVLTLTQLAVDYFRWHQRPRVYRAISSWWAKLSGEERGVIIAMLVTLVISPLAGALFRLAQSLVESLLPK